MPPAVNLLKFRPGEDPVASKRAVGIRNAATTTLLFCGSDFERKGLDRAIEALAATEIDVELLVIGSSGQEAHFRAAPSSGRGRRSCAFPRDEERRRSLLPGGGHPLAAHARRRVGRDADRGDGVRDPVHRLRRVRVCARGTGGGARTSCSQSRSRLASCVRRSSVWPRTRRSDGAGTTRARCRRRVLLESRGQLVEDDLVAVAETRAHG